MASHQSWGWDLDDMRSAGQMIAETPIGTPPRTIPVVSGFTPINLPQNPVNLGNGNRSRASGNHSAKVQFEEPGERNPKPRKLKGQTSTKPVTSKRPKKQIGRSEENIISKDLPRTKPGLETPSRLPDLKVRGSSSDVLVTSEAFESSMTCGQPLLEEGEASPSTLFTDTGETRSDDQFSLAERLRAEINAQPLRNIPDVTPSKLHQIYSSGVTPQGLESLEGIERTDLLRPIDHVDDQYLTTGQTSPFWQSHSFQEFEPPPSAQPPKVASEEFLDSAFFKLDLPSEIVNEADADATGGTGINRLSTSGNYLEQVEAEFAEDEAIENNYVSKSSPWPDDVSMPDAVIIYNEEIQPESSTTPKFVEVADSQPSKALNPVSGNAKEAARLRKTPSNGSENECDDVDLESSLVDLDSPTRAVQPSSPHTSPPRPSSPKLKWLPPVPFDSSKGLIKAPAVSQDFPHLVPKNAMGIYIPFVRPPFPKPIQNRSSIIGLTNSTVLRLCFRIVEAINAAVQASRNKTDAIVELYARVLTSSREADGGFKQTFKFADLFTDRPPHLNGVSNIWKGVALWDQDSRVFLGNEGKGKMCRIVGRIKKGEDPKNGYLMTVLSIWEVDWEDVGIAKGVVCS